MGADGILSSWIFKGDKKIEFTKTLGEVLSNISDQEVIVSNNLKFQLYLNFNNIEVSSLQSSVFNVCSVLNID